jgi:hypothetical protein
VEIGNEIPYPLLLYEMSILKNKKDGMKKKRPFVVKSKEIYIEIFDILFN